MNNIQLMYLHDEINGLFHAEVEPNSKRKESKRNKVEFIITVLYSYLDLPIPNKLDDEKLNLSGYDVLELLLPIINKLILSNVSK